MARVTWQDSRFYDQTAWRIPQVAKLVAASLFGEGYRQTSRHYGIISRVDISTEAMREMFIRDNFGDRNSGIPGLPLEQQEDYYRRVMSNDSISGVPELVLRLLRALG